MIDGTDWDIDRSNDRGRLPLTAGRLLGKISPCLARQQEVQLGPDDLLQSRFRADVYRLNFSGGSQHEERWEASSLVGCADFFGVIGRRRHRHGHG